MGSGIQAIDKTNELLSVCVEMPSVIVPWYIHVTNSLKYYPQNFCGMCTFHGSSVSML